MKLVIFPAIDETRLSAVQAASGTMHVVNCQSLDQALDEIGNADAFFGKMTPELLAAAQQLRWVQSPSASLEHYLFPSLVEHPCTLTNMRGLFSDVVANHVFGFILTIARNLHIYRRQQLQQSWQPLGQETDGLTLAQGVGTVTGIDQQHMHLADCTLGVVGVGHIGAEICRRGAAFGMKILGVDPHPRDIDGVDAEIRPMSAFSDLLASSDFVVIAAPHTPETEKMFRTEQFQQMKPTAWLINIGRGIIVDLQDLVSALKSKTIAGAALDVFETEPLPEDHPLWTMENVLITPHVAAASIRVPERHLATLVENVRRFANGQELLNVVDKRMWY